MAFGTLATARPSLRLPPSSLSSPPKTCSLSKTISKTQCPRTSSPLPTSTTLITLLSIPYEAKALDLPKEQILSSLTQVEGTIDQVQEVGSNFLDVALRVFQAVANTVKPGMDAALPILQKSGEQLVKVASPAISDASKKAQEAIEGSGFDTEPVLSAAKIVVDTTQQASKVIEKAKPIASSTVETIVSADPTVIVGTAGALFLTYLLFPPIWSTISYIFRGYKGELTPAQALDLISTKNHLIIDIRSEKEKDKAGIPRLPSSAKNRMIAIPLEELPSKLRGLVKNTKKVEAEIAAVKISFVKKMNKGSNVIILDSYSDSAKTVARALTSLGFKNCWTVADGFSGRRGWFQSRLGTDTYKFSVEVISQSQVIPSSVRRLGTTSSANFLPGGSD